ncbi:efflux RND transporter permease subunit [Aliikangiella marina]|uniref:Efflux RND transporter permease subunit n=1 Tax=Aliikangiella marina TaxID=1712262 RepID=A0A545T1P1_9GAMM|nr:efflux RND transporter permease subunit [Aliikangiella marina]TQV71099.1 efflux RND transporter permease subunit [Aliikangiella marina]
MKNAASLKTLLYREPRLFALLVGTIMVLGLSSYLTIGKQEDPTITNLFATVITPYPGADPQRVEALVSKKLEDELKTIPEIKEVKSNSRTGISIVNVELSQFINDQEIEQAWAEIRDAIEDARTGMPAGVGPTEFDNDRTGAFTSISLIKPAEGNVIGPAILGRYAKQLQDQLRLVSGTKDVELFGEPEEVVYVKLDPVKLNAIQLTAPEVARIIQQADVKNSAGKADTAQSSLVIEIDGEAKSLSRLKSIPIKTFNQQQLLLGDIAEFEKTVANPENSIGLSHGEQVVLIAARMKPDLRVDHWTQRINRKIDEFKSQLPVDIEHQLVFSQQSYTSQRLTEVFINMLIGVSLVVAVLLISMGWRAALVVAIVLPLTSLLSLSVLQFMGIPIHQMSVTGLIVALGLLVDAAIVMTDDIGKRIARGEAKLSAISGAIDRLKIPLLASTATTALAFIPMVLLPGPAGDFVGSIAISVVIMLVSSFVLALTVTPSLAGWLLHQASNPLVSMPGLAEKFKRSLSWSMQYPKSAVAVALILPVLGFLLFPTLTAQFFPGVDRDQFYIQVDMGKGVSIQQTKTAVTEISDILDQQEGVKDHQWVIGQNAPAFYYNMIRNRDSDPGFAEGLITTRSPETTENLIPILQRQLDQAIPQAQILVRGLVQGPPVNAPVEIKIVGPNLQQLSMLGDEVRERMSRIDDITHTRHSLNAGAPKFVFKLDEAKVQRAGYQLTEIADLMNASLTGIRSGSILEQTEELPIIVRLTDDLRTEMDWFRHLTLPVRSAEQGERLVPLSALGEAVLQPSENAIVRENGERINTVQGYIQRGLLPQEVLKQLQQVMADDPVNLPPGYRFVVGGDADARNETVNNLMASMGLIITLTIATIVLTFRSYRLSIITFVVCILSAGLSMLSLAVMNYPFGIQALIGVIGSIGVSINAAIIILTALQADEGAMAGDRNAIQRVVFQSSRHIISTTTTTFGGFLPLILAGGGFWPPFAMAIAGGVLLSTVVSFYFTPTMFTLWYAGKRHLSTFAVQSEASLETAK